MSCGCVEADNAGMVALDGLLRHVMPLVPEIPYDLALDMMRQAYIEFARKTEILEYTQVIVKQKDVYDYKLECPEGYTVFSVKPERGPLLRWSSPHYWFAAYGQRFRVASGYLVFDRADSRDGVPTRIKLGLLPEDCVEYIPSQLQSAYGKQIAMGAAADMLDMPNRGWYNPRAAAAKRVSYERAIAAAKVAVLTNNGAVAPTMKGSRWLA